MLRYILIRLLSTIPVMVVVAAFVFLMLRLSPGDPAAVIAGDYATAADVENIREKLGLNEPVLVQFGHWIGQLLQGDLGTSIFTNLPVTTLIGQRLEPTLMLALTTILFTVVVAVPLGTLAAWKSGTLIDRFVMLFSVAGFSVPVSVLGYILIYVLAIHTSLSGSERRQRVIGAMEDVKLPEPASMYDAYLHQLSGGQRQRIMIAMALALEPALLIADEPTTALDVTTQAQILKLIKEIQQNHGTGVMFITHDFGVVAEIADRVVVMQNGRIVEQGDASTILKNPQHTYTRMLIGSVPSLTPPDRPLRGHGEPALSATDLNKVYGSRGLFGTGRVVHAAKDVDLVVQRGETLGVVGESGSGKSTVARCIVRLVDPSSGELTISGTDIARITENNLRPHRRDIQIVFQDPYRSLNPRCTIGQSITEGPMKFGLAQTAATERARELMRVVGLSPDALERFPHQFSGGKRQRICIARALAMEPKVLIADEAVSALDVSVQAQVLDLLDQVRERFDLAMLFITYDLRVAAQICDRIMVMQHGVVVEQGLTRAIYSDPQHAYTQQLLNAAPGRDAAFLSA